MGINRQVKLLKPQHHPLVTEMIHAQIVHGAELASDFEIQKYSQKTVNYSMILRYEIHLDRFVSSLVLQVVTSLTFCNFTVKCFCRTSSSRTEFLQTNRISFFDNNPFS